MMGSESDGGASHSQSGDVSERIQVGGAAGVTDPKALLTGSLKARIVALTFGTQGISPFKLRRFPVNGKTIIGRECFVFGAAPVLLAVVPVFVVTGAAARLGKPEGTAELLADSSVVKGFPVLVHGQPGRADQTVGGGLIRVLGIALSQRNNGVAFVGILHQVVDRFGIIGFVAQERTLPKGQDRIGRGKNIGNNAGIRCVGGSGQFIKRQTGNTVHQHMVLVTPIKFITPFAMLVRRGLNAQGAVGVGFWMILRLEFVFDKGLRIVLLCVGRNRRRVQADKRGVHNAEFVEFLYLLRHDFLQAAVVQFFDKTVIGPVGRQRLHDVEPTVMCDQAVIVQIIRQIRDL